MANTQIILLERVDNLGQMGDVVSVRPGYARNYLLPQKKALRASKENVAYFEAQKKTLEAESDKRRKEAEKLARKLEGVKVPLIRQASESGQLFGSVTARDIALAVADATGEKVERQMVQINQNFKLVGLFAVDVALHPEVKVAVTVNIARTVEEADMQAKTGKALIAEDNQSRRSADAAADEAAFLDAEALEAKKARDAEGQAEEAAESAESQAKSKARAEKKKAKKADTAEEAAE